MYAVAWLLIVTANLSASASSNASEAQIINFVQPSLLDGNDGLPPSPAAPFQYGAPSLMFDTEGNAIDSHESSLTFFNDRYYMYSHAWACGTMTDLTGVKSGGSANDSAGKCGLAIYSSPDLVAWTFEDLYQPQGLPEEAAQPVTVWSPGLEKYVMWFKAGGNFNTTGFLFYALSDKPEGPWGEHHVATGNYLSHNFAIAKDSDGTGWIATCSFAGFDPEIANKPVWSIWIQQLKADLTGTVGTNETMVQAMASGVDFQGIGLVEHDAWWYLTGGPTAGNAPTSIAYIRAPSPLGPWKNVAGDCGKNLTEGTVISMTGCMGQNKGIAKLPSTKGDVVLSQVMGYRTSPSNPVKDGVVLHGDNSQAIATTYFFLLEFDDARHEIRPLRCQTTVSIPLANELGPEAVPSAVPHQSDCRIRAGSKVVQRYATPRCFNGSLSIPAWQRTKDEGLAGNNGTHLKGNLTITLGMADGRQVPKSFRPDQVSWVPHNVEISVGNVSDVSTIIFSTEAANGCYGTLVRPRSDHSNWYGTTLANGTKIEAPRAEIAVS